jgi:hypothetical protein
MTVTDDEFDREFAYTLAESEVAEEAPEELPILQAQHDVFLKKGLQKTRSDEDSPLALGMGDAAQLLTPAALFIGLSVFDAFKSELRKQLGQKTKEVVRELFNLFKNQHSAAPSSLPQLSDEQIARLSETVVSAAKASKIDEQTAKRLASKMVARLQPKRHPSA